MINIKGQFAEAIIYTDTLDSGAEGLIKALCNSPASENSKIRVMPDVHSGHGCAVGMTMTYSQRVAPGIVGVDIGCGMEVFKVKCKRFDPIQLDKIVHSKIPSGFSNRKTPHRFSEEINLEELKCAQHIKKDDALLSIGSLGSGNHFIEVDKASDGYYLVIHSGSRHLGVLVEKYYHEKAYAYSGDKAPYELSWLEGEMLEDYLHDMKLVQNFARVNRRAIADEIIKGMKFDVLDTFSTIHNYIDTDNNIIRKGAISAEQGEKVIIPLNMRDGCLICTGKGNAEWNFSAPHGAGRIMSRADVMASFTLSQYKKEMKNVFTTSVSRETLDECPMAYKNPEIIVSAIEPTVDIIERITPMYNFKASKEV